MIPKITTILLLVVTALFQLTLAEQTEVPGSLINRTILAEQPQSFSVESCDSNQVYSTCSDCYNVMVCLGDYMDYRMCQYQTPETPFCNNGECTDEMNFSPDCSPPTITCTGTGFYPDPRTCQLYHYCEEKNNISETYQCPSGYAFNHETNLCKPRLRADDCPNCTVKCNLNTIFTRYGSSKKFFAFCVYGGGPMPYEIRIFRCPEETEFDGKTCVYQCTKEGRFGDSSDSRTYYECLDSGSGLVAYTHLCPSGTIFNSTISVCVTALKV